MTTFSKVNQAGAAVINRRLVVHLLRAEGPMSRRQLAERTGLRSSTLTYIARDLMEAGVIRAGGKLDKAGAGKKQVLLEVDPGLGWAVGVGIEADAASLVMLDSRGDVIDRDRLPLREPFELLPQQLKARLDSWTTRHGTPAGRLLAIGVGMSGVIDPDRGVVLRSTRFKLKNWNLAEQLHKVFADVHVKIDNDSNFAALAEHRQGNAADVGDFLYFLVNSSEHGDRYAIQSLGSSLFVNGQLFRGRHFAAGEIDSLLEGDHYDTVQAEHILTMASPDGAFPQPLERLANGITRTLVGAADLLDPAAIILGGNLSLSNQAMIAYIERQLNERILPVPGRHVSVRPSRFMDHGVSMGAGIAAMDDALLATGAETARPQSPPPTGAKA